MLGIGTTIWYSHSSSHLFKNDFLFGDLTLFSFGDGTDFYFGS